jgi:tetratricopeptide (TPR) repeat protein
MQITNKHWWAAGLVVAIGAFFAWSYQAKAPAPQDEPADVATTTEAVAVPKVPVIPSVAPAALVVSPSDTIASWNFPGAYTGNAELMAKANAEIARFTALIGTGTYTDYTLYVSIANEYDLQGDGKNEFAYLKKALAIDSEKTGLAWYNAGQLFTRLGAYATARTAFERAARAEPITQYEQALADFLAAHPATQ